VGKEETAADDATDDDDNKIQVVHLRLIIPDIRHNNLRALIFKNSTHYYLHENMSAINL
jgi:hypothetical protein